MLTVCSGSDPSDPGDGFRSLSVECGGLPQIQAIPGTTTLGTQAAECIIGTEGPDEIRALAGDDIVFGLGGDDIIDGGPGNDEIHGGAGNDEIDGGPQDDTLLGDEGDDIIAGGANDDLLDGGPGTDEVSGDAGDDIVRGGSGDDPDLDGGPGNDAIFGDDGDDTMSGGPGDDFLDGRQGDDTLLGGPGRDEMIGGPGADALDGGSQDDLCNETEGTTTRCEATSYGRGSIVVADRASHTLSVIDVQTDEVVRTVAMPDDGEPMYLTYSPQNAWLFVADRANDRATVFDARTLTHVTDVPLGEGVFHCWIDRTEGQLWVTNDIDDTASVIDTRKLEVVETVPMPADLVADGYFPHDVTLDRQDDGVFVTLIGGTQGGVVLRYSSRTFEETARRFLGGDPHVTLRRYLPNLMYVNSQEADLVYLVDRSTLVDVQVPLSVDNAHGAVMNTEYETRFVYTTNIADGGIGGLVTIDTATQTVTAETDTPLPTPHNIVLDPRGEKLYVTHSGGTANAVSVYTVNPTTGEPTLVDTVTVGFNPFGLTHIPYEFE